MQSKQNAGWLSRQMRQDREPRLLLRVFLLNCLIGACFWISSRNATLLSYLLASNAIGFSASFLNVVSARIASGWRNVAVRVLLAAPLSVVAGVQLSALAGVHIPELSLPLRLDQWEALAPPFLVAGIACAFASAFIHSLRVKAALDLQHGKLTELRQSETAAQLALLQAQIEPHFLFNTLANVHSLIERDPANASTMLDNLNRYLRASLGRTRKQVSSIEEEVELVDALLAIASMRLGERLQYRIALPAALRILPLPPLLLQPLVENAVIHGIEPAVDGGRIDVDISCSAGMLCLCVVDTGVGLGGASELHGGVGLANVRSRLAMIYGGAARLSIVSNQTRGVTARLLIPLPASALPR